MTSIKIVCGTLLLAIASYSLVIGLVYAGIRW